MVQGTSEKAWSSLSRDVPEGVAFLIHPSLTCCLGSENKMTLKVCADLGWSKVTSNQQLSPGKAWNVLPPLSWLEYVHLSFFLLSQKESSAGCSNGYGCVCRNKGVSSLWVFLTPLSYPGVWARADPHVMPASKTVWQDFWNRFGQNASEEYSKR